MARRPAALSPSSTNLHDRERRAQELDEQHFAEIDVAMLYIEEARARAERAAAALESGELRRALKGLITAPEVELLGRRVAGVLDRSWRFPSPTSGWSVPWPPI